MNKVQSRTVTTAAGQLDTVSSDLIVVDPLNPTSPITIEVAGQWHGPLAMLFKSPTNPAGEAIALHTRVLVYEKNGALYRLNLAKDGSPPAATRLSSMTVAQICHRFQSLSVTGLGDLTTFDDRSVLVLRKPGADARCDTPDDAFVAVRLNMGPGDAPIPAYEVVTVVLAPDQSPSGYVVKVGNEIQLVDTNFANPVALFTASSELLFPTMWVTSARRQMLSFIEGNQWRIYDLSVRSGPTTLATAAPGEELRKEEGSTYSDNGLAWINSPTSGRLLRSIQGGAPTTLVQEQLPIMHAFPTPTRVVYRLFDPSGTQGQKLRSVPKSGGAPTTLFSAASSLEEANLGLANAFPLVAGETIFYGTFVGASPLSNRVLVMGSDGSNPRTIADATLIYCSGPNPVRDDFNDSSACFAVWLAEGVSTASGNGLSGASVRAYGANGQMLVDYGRLPAGREFGALGPGPDFVLWGQHSLLTLAAILPAPIGSGPTSDVFLLKTDMPGLTRVTSFVP